MAEVNRIIKILLLLSCFVFAKEPFAKERVALVIGNSDYKEQSLRNPTNDARDISNVLQNLGFEVDLRLNTSQEDMESAVQRFGEKLKGNSVGFFYYSGHGVQYEDSNYLIPIGAMSRVSAPDHLRYKTVDAGYILGVMKQAGNGLNIVVLDACRNNPFKSFSRSMNKGLKRISGAEGTIVAYSTSPGKVALDGSGRNSPYTDQLIKFIKTPDLPVEIMFKKVRKGVKERTGGKQSPWYEASIDGDFFFITDKRVLKKPQALMLKNKTKVVATDVKAQLKPVEQESRYVDNGDGTVSDKLNGLMWKKCSEGQYGNNCLGEADKIPWKNLTKISSQVSYSKYNDWRLPMIEELKTLVYCSTEKKGSYNDGCAYNYKTGENFQRPTINLSVFPNTPPDYSWSSSLDSNEYYSNGVWTVHFGGGYSYLGSNSGHLYTRLVRTTE